MHLTFEKGQSLYILAFLNPLILATDIVIHLPIIIYKAFLNYVVVTAQLLHTHHF